MPYLPSAAADALVHPRQSHRLARLWWIRRTDGFDLRLTDHDHKLTFDLFTYTPIGGVDATAIRKAGALEEQNFEARGVISSDAITYDDLRAGRYHEAEVNEYAVDWMYPWVGQLQHTRYWITETSFDGERWTAQVSGIPYWLRFATGEVLARNCGADLGDDRCGVALAPLQETADIGTIATDRLVFTANSIASTSDDYWNEGTLEWISGANIGIVSKIRDYVDSSRTITLYLRTPFAMDTSDSFTMTPGCDKRKVTCSTKYANVANFRGFEFMPGTDKLIQTPTS